MVQTGLASQSLTPVQESLWTNSRARRRWLCLWKWCIVGVGVRLAQQQAKERNAGGHPNEDFIFFFQPSWIQRFHIICLRYYSFARYFFVLVFIISFSKMKHSVNGSSLKNYGNLLLLPFDLTFIKENHSHTIVMHFQMKECTGSCRWWVSMSLASSYHRVPTLLRLWRNRDFCFYLLFSSSRAVSLGNNTIAHILGLAPVPSSQSWREANSWMKDAIYVAGRR